MFEDYFKILKSKGDGNCLFRSIINSSKHLKDFRYEDTNKLREDCCNVIKNNEFNIQKGIPKHELDLHINKMKNDGIWGTTSQIVAMSILLKKTIINLELKDGLICACSAFYEDCEEDSICILHDKCLETDVFSNEDFKDVIFILWNGKNHWDGLKLII